MTARPLNPEKPYYEWEDEGELTIYSECCADHFTKDEEIVLRDHLLAKHPIEEES